MHMADSLLSPAVASGMYALSTAAAAVGVNKIRKSNEEIKIPEMGVMGAFVFAAQMVNFTIPGTGSSGHLCGGMLLSAMLGPEAGFISMIGILLIQCLFFADGGLMALGGNIWNMAFYGCFIGGGIIWRLMMKNGMNKKKIFAASVIGSVLTLELGAFSVTVETLLSKITKLPFGLFCGSMMPIHVVIGLVEGLITAAVLCFVYEARKELLWTGSDYSANENENENVTARFSYKSIIITLAVTTVVIAAGVSLLASSNPDGLEWSIENLTGSTEIEDENMENSMAIASDIQEHTAFLPDYSIKNSDSELLGTSVSGIVGSLLVVVLLALLCLAIRFIRNSSLKKE